MSKDVTTMEDIDDYMKKIHHIMKEEFGLDDFIKHKGLAELPQQQTNFFFNNAVSQLVIGQIQEIENLFKYIEFSPATFAKQALSENIWFNDALALIVLQNINNIFEPNINDLLFHGTQKFSIALNQNKVCKYLYIYIFFLYIYLFYRNL